MQRKRVFDGALSNLAVKLDDFAKDCTFKDLEYYKAEAKKLNIDFELLLFLAATIEGHHDNVVDLALEHKLEHILTKSKTAFNMDYLKRKYPKKL